MGKMQLKIDNLLFFKIEQNGHKDIKLVQYSKSTA